MKMTIISLTLMFVSCLCIAPPLPEYVHTDRIEHYKTECVRIEQERQFALFVDHLGMRESGNQWKIINQINCIGKYQFAYVTLKTLGYPEITPYRFRVNPEIFPEDIQYQVLLALFKYNETALKDYMQYIGQSIGGVIITKSGMLAGAHLGGAGSVKLFIESGGRINKRDINGTSVKTYMQEFSIYTI